MFYSEQIVNSIPKVVCEKTFQVFYQLWFQVILHSFYTNEIVDQILNQTKLKWVLYLVKEIQF